MNLHVTYALWCLNYNGTMLRPQHLQFLSVAAGNGPPDESCTIHRKVDKLLIKQYTFYDDGCGPTQSLER